MVKLLFSRRERKIPNGHLKTVDELADNMLLQMPSYHILTSQWNGSAEARKRGSGGIGDQGLSNYHIELRLPSVDAKDFEENRKNVTNSDCSSIGCLVVQGQSHHLVQVRCMADDATDAKLFSETEVCLRCGHSLLDLHFGVDVMPPHESSAQANASTLLFLPSVIDIAYQRSPPAVPEVGPHDIEVKLDYAQDDPLHRYANNEQPDPRHRPEPHHNRYPGPSSSSSRLNPFDGLCIGHTCSHTMRQVCVTREVSNARP